MAGRPSDYTDELADEFCNRVSEGRSLASVCADDDMPSQQTIYRWMREKPPFREKIALSREERKENTRHKLVAMADRVLEDTALDPQRVNAAAHALAKAEALMAPKTRVEVSGPNGGPIETKTDDMDVARRVAFLLSKATKD